MLSLFYSLPHLSQIKPHIIVFMFIDEDVPRVLEAYRVLEGMNKPSFELNNGELVLRSMRKEPPYISMKVLEKSKLFNPFYQRYLESVSDNIVGKIFSDLITCIKNNRQSLTTKLHIQTAAKLTRETNLITKGIL